MPSSSLVGFTKMERSPIFSRKDPYLEDKRQNQGDKYRPALWMFSYVVFNLILTIHNKWVLNRLNFQCPWILTGIHVGISGIGAFIFQKSCMPRTGKPTELSWIGHSKLLMFSLLYTINIAISNVSLALVSLSFHQLARSLTPAFTVIMDLAFLGKHRSPRVYLSLLPVILGVSLTAVGAYSEVSFTLSGFFLTFLGVMLSALKGIVTNVIMVGPMKLNPLELIWRMAIPSLVQCIFFGMFFGELSHLWTFAFNDVTRKFAWFSLLKLMINGTLAALLNIASFTANKTTSALAMTVAGNIKQAISVILAIYIFDSKLTTCNAFGAAIALVGGAWYSYESYWEKSRCANYSELASKTMNQVAKS